MTIEQVKAHWIKFFPEPSVLERNGREKKQAHARLIAVIKLGRYDNEAEEKALVWNISEYERCENIEAANRLREDLKAARLKLVEESKLALQKTESDRAAVGTVLTLAALKPMQAQLSAMGYTIRQSR